jgi:glutaminyl-tRNA synthetase
VLCIDGVVLYSYQELLSIYLASKEEKKPAAKSSVEQAREGEEEEGAATIAELMKNKVHFHAPGQNHTTDGYVVTSQTERLLREHLARTAGQVRDFIK